MKISIYILLIMMLTLSCEKDEIMNYEGRDGVNFNDNFFDTDLSHTYSFLGNDSGEEIIEIPVDLMGRMAEQDRIFQIEVIEQEGPVVEFEVVENSIPAGETSGILGVKVFNDAQLATANARILLRIAPSEDLQPGAEELQQFELTWTDQVVVPAWNYYRFFFTQVASTAAYRAIVESTGLTSLSVAEFRLMGQTSVEALGTQFGNYVKQWNLDNPNNPLLHDDGPQAGQPMIPLYYSRSIYD